MKNGECRTTHVPSHGVPGGKRKYCKRNGKVRFVKG